MLDDGAFWWEFVKAVVLLYGPVIFVVVLSVLLFRWLYNRISRFNVAQGKSFLAASNEEIEEAVEEIRNGLDGFRSPREKDDRGELPGDPDGPGGGWPGHHGSLDG